MITRNEGGIEASIVLISQLSGYRYSQSEFNRFFLCVIFSVIKNSS